MIVNGVCGRRCINEILEVCTRASSSSFTARFIFFNCVVID